MAAIGDPTISGLVGQPGSAGRNVTGFHVMAPPELGGQRLRISARSCRDWPRAGILWNPSDIIHRDRHRYAEDGEAIGVRLESLESRDPRRSSRRSRPRSRPDRCGDRGGRSPDVHGARADRGFAAMGRLPAIYGLREFVDAGGLMAYGTDRRDLFRRCAGYVDRILQGRPAADLPVEPPKKFALAINLKTARMLGLTIPASLLASERITSSSEDRGAGHTVLCRVQGRPVHRTVHGAALPGPPPPRRCRISSWRRTWWRSRRRSARSLLIPTALSATGGRLATRRAVISAASWASSRPSCPSSSRP